MWKIARFSLASRPLNTESFPLLALRLATRHSHRVVQKDRNVEQEDVHVCQQVCAVKCDGENVSGAEMCLVAKFLVCVYLNAFCTFMVKTDPFS